MCQGLSLECKCDCEILHAAWLQLAFALPQPIWTGRIDTMLRQQAQEDYWQLSRTSPESQLSGLSPAS